MLGVLSLLAAVTAPPPAADPMTTRMAIVFDDLCLKAFPDDQALDAAMTARKATPLTPEQVKITLRDDPGRGWHMDSEGQQVLIFLELPPFHACSVRFPVPGDAVNVAPHRSVADAYEASNAGFSAQDPFDMDQGDIHIHALQDYRVLPDGSRESLMLIDQHIIDPARRARGETGIMRRFVRQIAPAP